METALENGMDKSVPVCLIADDDPIVRSIVSLFLEALGIDTREAENGYEAIAALEQGSFAFVLMDCLMPGLSGLETTRRIRDGEAGTLNSLIPIIALTGNDQAEDRSACLRVGMNEYLSKPLSLAKLSAAIQRLPGAEKWRLEKQTARLPLEQQGEKSGAFDIDEFRASYSDDKVAAEIAALFLNEMPVLLREANQDARVNDWINLNNKLHRIKGSVGTIGVTFLAEASENILKKLRPITRGEAGPKDKIRAELKELTQNVEQVMSTLRAWLDQLNVSGQ